MTERLTTTSIAQLKPKKNRYLVFDSAIPNLYVAVHPTGRKTFNVQYVHENDDGTKERNCLKVGDASILSIIQAREKAKELLAKVTLGQNIDRKKSSWKKNDYPLLSDVVDAYEELWVPLHNSGEETLRAIKMNFNDFMDWPVKKLNIVDIEAWRLKVLEKRKVEKDAQVQNTPEGVEDSPTTNGNNKIRRKPIIKKVSINRYTTQLQSMLNWAVAREIIPENPISKLKKLQETDAQVITRYLSDDERQRLYKALDEREDELRAARARSRQHANRQYLKSLDKSSFADYFKPMVLIALHTGMRRNALFSLCWGDIDFDAETILLRADSSKTSKSLIIPANSVVIDTLKKWKKQTDTPFPTELVFPNPATGKKFDNLKKTWQAVLKKANIENYRWHDMRHDFASRLVIKGVDLNTVRELLGHSDMKMTQRYAHLSPERKKTAVNMLANELISAKKAPKKRGKSSK